jgi:prepilin-type N-terminal cleavage/methylation domain-containing protein/prepilin-type processing-associated H-X9-DG protein
MKRAFTLIELLVVIAIIGLLLGILLPSLSAARELARQTVCASRLRSLGMAVNLYANENDDWLPSAEPPNREPVSRQHWFMNKSLLQNLGVSLSYDDQGGLVGPSGEPPALICPSHHEPTKTRARQGEPSITHAYGLSFGMNGTFGIAGRPDHTEYRRLQEFGSPSEVLALGDCRGTSLGPGVLLYHACVAENFDYRHRGKLNVAFLDAHVTAVRPEDVPMGFSNRYRPFWSTPKP